MVTFNQLMELDVSALEQVQGPRDFLDKEADGAVGTGGTKGLEELQRKAGEIQQEALGKGMWVTADGRIDWELVTDPNDPDSDGIVEDHRRTADGLQARLSRILDQATANDEWLAQSLRVVFGTVHNFESENRRYDVLEPTARDRKVHNQLNNVAAYFATIKGWPTAAGLVKHYLDGSGKTVEVEPQDMMEQIPAFQEDVDTTIREDVQGRPDGPFTTDWKSTAPDPADGDSSMEWYYALNHFQYRVVGEVHDGEATYRVEVRKRYDWGIPSEHRATVSGGAGPAEIEMEQADIAHLHSVGMARDFDVVGTSDEMTVCA